MQTEPQTGRLPAGAPVPAPAFAEGERVRVRLAHSNGNEYWVHGTIDRPPVWSAEFRAWGYHFVAEGHRDEVWAWEWALRRAPAAESHDAAAAPSYVPVAAGEGTHGPA